MVLAGACAEPQYVTTDTTPRKLVRADVVGCWLLSTVTAKELLEAVMPERYGNLSGGSGVRYYMTGDDFIAIQFSDSAIYVYNYAQPGRDRVERMKQLAAAGKGLATFITQHVRNDFASKQQTWPDHS